MICILMFMLPVYASVEEKQLLMDLLNSTYNKDARPVLMHNDTVVVQVRHTIKQILDVDEQKELFTTSGWCVFKWRDVYLSWNPDKYNGIRSINVNPKKIWLPDIKLYDNVNPEIFEREIHHLQSRIRIDYSGNAMWVIRARFITQCHLDIHDFPFDTQSCSLNYRSSSYEKGKIDISPTSAMDLKSGRMHYAWNVLNFSSEIVLSNFTEGEYESIHFSITFKRKALCQTLTKILPPFIVGTLVLFSFLLPTASGGRLTFSVTLLLAMIFFMVSTTRLVPRDDATVPLIYKFFVATLAELLLLHICLIYGLHLYYKTSYDPPMPPWVRNIVLGKLSYWVGTQIQRDPNNNDDKFTLKEEEMLSIIEVGLLDTVSCKLSKNSKTKFQKPVDEGEAEYDEVISREWRLVAMTIDRCFFCIFSMAFVSILIAFSSAALF